MINGLVGLVVFLISWFLAYKLLLTINNAIWGYKGFPMDKKSPAYQKRKKLLSLVSIPLAMLFVITRAIQLVGQ